jgi:hypothetical protein
LEDPGGGQKDLEGLFEPDVWGVVAMNWSGGHFFPSRFQDLISFVGRVQLVQEQRVVRDILRGVRGR